MTDTILDSFLACLDRHCQSRFGKPMVRITFIQNVEKPGTSTPDKATLVQELSEFYHICQRFIKKKKAVVFFEWRGTVHINWPFLELELLIPNAKPPTLYILGSLDKTRSFMEEIGFDKSLVQGLIYAAKYDPDHPEQQSYLDNVWDKIELTFPIRS